MPPPPQPPHTPAQTVDLVGTTLDIEKDATVGTLECVDITSYGTVTGNLMACSDLTVSGNLFGNFVSCSDLTVSGNLTGNVVACSDLTVSGNLTGNVVACSDLTVTGNLNGNVVSCLTLDVTGNVPNALNVKYGGLTFYNAGITLPAAVDDAAAAMVGVPLGGLYYSTGSPAIVRIRTV
jgi:cytoskeletal protein CcmA (bactofilin family)